MGGVLIFVPDADTPGKSDATGAFHPEARAFARSRSSTRPPGDTELLHFPSRKTVAERRAFCSARFAELKERVDTVAFFCHGYRDGLQAGFTKNTVLAFARLLHQHATPNAYVLLYACQAGRNGDDSEADERLSGPGGDGGFADALRDACIVLGRAITVMAHSTTGHTTYNPYVRRFRPDTKAGGEWYIDPKSSAWARWIRALRTDPTLRYRFPYMSSAEIEAELLGPPRVG